MNGMEERKKIAVFSSSIYEPMVRTMINGIIKAAEETGDKVICFTSFSDSYSSKVYGKFHLYDEGDVVAIELPDLNDFDGIIKISTYFSESVKEHLEKILAHLDSKPDMIDEYIATVDEFKEALEEG